MITQADRPDPVVQAAHLLRLQMEAHFGEFPQCDECRHLHADGAYCDAFPDGKGIPTKLLIFGPNMHDHGLPFPGDHGILFEAKD